MTTAQIRIENGFGRSVGGYRLFTITLATVTVLLLIFCQQSFSEDSHMHQPASGNEKATEQPKQMVPEVLYSCPMNCISPVKKPGKCPVCGMELVAASDNISQQGSSPPQLALSPEAVHKAGIQVTPVQRKPITADIRLYGRIEYDPVEQYRVTAFAPGVIDRIHVKRAGQSVRRGDPLFDFHSSELFFLEKELFDALKLFPDTVDYRPARGQTYKRLMRPSRRTFNIRDENGVVSEEKKVALEKVDQSRRKMRLLGLSEADIDNVMTRGRPTGISTVTTPTTGIILDHKAYKGTYVNTGETIFTVANPRYLWARLDAYESDFAWLRIGQSAEFTTDAFPGKTFAGKVLYLDPFFDPDTRTFKIGVLYEDSHSKLKPNMLVRSVIHAPMTEKGVSRSDKKNGGKDPLVIPESAPLITGTRAIVYVQDPHQTGSYSAREVVLGPRSQGYYMIKEGLQEGQLVVTNGNFKIDSAIQIQAKPSMMNHGTMASPPMGHSGHATHISMNN